MKLSFKKGFTLIELLMSIAIIAILFTIVLSSFLKFRDNQSLSKDTETVVAVLREARNQTLLSKNSSVYGVHFTATTTTLFVGGTYSAGSPTNQNYSLVGSETSMAVSLTGSGSDVVFQRLSGETNQNGTIIISSPRLTTTKTITIYKTGVVEVQ